jgi:hypothetical protein
MTHRSPLAVLVLTLLTFTLYGYYWLYKTTAELRDETGRGDLSPGVDLLLAVLTLGLWGLYATWRNATVVHETLRARGVDHTDSSATVLIFNLSSFIWGAGWLVSLLFLQSDYNRLADRSRRVLTMPSRAYG